MNQSAGLTELLRRDIIDIIIIENTPWSGRLSETDFLQRIFDLENMPSTDRRFSNARQDIFQHRINNYDWEDDWIFNDTRFNLLTVADETFLQFICEMLHPVVCPDAVKARGLKEQFNSILKHANIELYEERLLTGRPVIKARTRTLSILHRKHDIVATSIVFDAEYVGKQIERMETAIHDDPSLAIGTAKELVETCCKTILEECHVEFSSNLDLAQLVKKTARELALTPEDIPDGAKAAKTIKRLLSNLASITQGMAELRNSYGTGHGKSASAKGLQPRHAKLAVGAASTLVVFLLETYNERK